MTPKGLVRFTRAKRRVMPLIILLDASASMNEVIDEEGMQRTGEVVVQDGQKWEVVTGGTSKLKVTNDAMRAMIASFAAVERAEVQVCVVAFGGDKARLHVPMQPATAVAWEDYAADGETPLGSAFAMAKELLEDRQTVPGDAYRPVVVLVSDGRPTDADWQARMAAFIGEGRSRKASRMALAIGQADTTVLRSFLGEQQQDFLFTADRAPEMGRFFSFLTMSVAQRSQSPDPDKMVRPADIKRPADEF